MRDFEKLLSSEGITMKKVVILDEEEMEVLNMSIRLGRGNGNGSNKRNTLLILHLFRPV